MEKIKTVIKNMLGKKSTDAFINESNTTELKKTLNIFDLLILGVSAVVGTGIFTIIGSAIVGSSDGLGAGTAVIVSMLIAALASLFSALAYSEIAAMIPVAGSAYTFTYATMGRLDINAGVCHREYYRSNGLDGIFNTVIKRI